MSGLQFGDEELVARAREGDHEAFTQLITRHQVALYNLTLRMVGSREDAADITQEAFLRAWEKLRSLRNASFKSWLFRIAVNLCYDHFRSRKRLTGEPIDIESAAKVIGLTSTQDPVASSEAAERVRLIRESIQALDPDLRFAIILRDVNGLAYDEIAAVLNIPLGTVKSRIARARGEVQDRLRLYPEVFNLPGAKDAANEN